MLWKAASQQHASGSTLLRRFGAPGHSTCPEATMPDALCYAAELSAASALPALNWIAVFHPLSQLLASNEELRKLDESFCPDLHPWRGHFWARTDIARDAESPFAQATMPDALCYAAELSAASALPALNWIAVFHPLSQLLASNEELRKLDESFCPDLHPWRGHFWARTDIARDAESPFAQVQSSVLRPSGMLK
eukprot:s8039_g1.t1